MTMQWFRWFAWRPVASDDRGLVWLRWVWRRHVPPRDLAGIPTCWTWDTLVQHPMTPTTKRVGDGWEISMNGMLIARVAPGEVTL